MSKSSSRTQRTKKRPKKNRRHRTVRNDAPRLDRHPLGFGIAAAQAELDRGKALTDAGETDTNSPRSV